MAYTVQLENYQGPLDLLLQLIERDQLDICDVSLAQVTSDYIAEVERLQISLLERDWFVDIASRLVLVKSRALLPISDSPIEAMEGDSSAEDLAEQLELYKLYRDASRELQKLAKNPSYLRTNKLSRDSSDKSYSNLSAQRLNQAFEQAMQQLNTKQGLQQSFSPQRVDLRDARSRALKKLRGQAGFTFDDFLEWSETRYELVVYFLCALELVHDNKYSLSSPGGEFKLERAIG